MKNGIPIDTVAIRLLNRQVYLKQHQIRYKNNDHGIEKSYTQATVKICYNDLISIRHAGQCYCGNILTSVKKKVCGGDRWYKLCSKTRKASYNCRFI